MTWRATAPAARNNALEGRERGGLGRRFCAAATTIEPRATSNGAQSPRELTPLPLKPPCTRCPEGDRNARRSRAAFLAPVTEANNRTLRRPKSPVAAAVTRNRTCAVVIIIKLMILTTIIIIIIVMTMTLTIYVIRIVIIVSNIVVNIVSDGKVHGSSRVNRVGRWHD